MKPPCLNPDHPRGILQTSALDKATDQTEAKPNPIYAMPLAFQKLGRRAPAPALPWNIRRAGTTIKQRLNINDLEIDGKQNIDSIRFKKIPKPVATNFAKLTPEQIEQNKKKREINKSVNFNDFSYVAYDAEDFSGDEDDARQPTIYVTANTKQDEPGYYRQNCFPDVILDSEKEEEEEKKANRLQPYQVFSSEAVLGQTSSQYSQQISESDDAGDFDSTQMETQLRRLYDRSTEIDARFYNALEDAHQKVPLIEQFLQRADNALFKERIVPLRESAERLLHNRRKSACTFDEIQATMSTKVSVIFYEMMVDSINNAIDYCSNRDTSDLILRFAEFSQVSDKEEDQKFVQRGIKSLAATVEGREQILALLHDSDKSAGLRTA